MDPRELARKRMQLSMMQGMATNQQRANTPLGQGLYGLAQILAAKKAGDLGGIVGQANDDNQLEFIKKVIGLKGGMPMGGGR